MGETQDLLWIALEACAGIGPVKAKALYDKAGSIEAIWQKIDSRPDMQHAEEVLSTCKREGIGLVTPDKATYPELLKTIYDPPILLFTKGRQELLKEPILAIVGARRCSSYGEKAAGRLAADLAAKGYTIVSGMAYGIDAAAHEGALRAQGHTIAVLGCGVDICYPEDHARLYRALAGQELIISEYLPGTPPLPARFPRRNRIISGLSAGVVVVEAGEQSGSLITAHAALDQGRDVYAVPGSIYAYASRGSNRLIQNGEAMLVLDASDIPAPIGIPKTEKAASDSPGDLQPIPDDTPAARILSAIEREQNLSDLGLAPDILQRELAFLEISGKIRRFDTGQWTTS